MQCAARILTDHLQLTVAIQKTEICLGAEATKEIADPQPSVVIQRKIEVQAKAALRETQETTGRSSTVIQAPEARAGINMYRQETNTVRRPETDSNPRPTGRGPQGNVTIVEKWVTTKPTVRRRFAAQVPSEGEAVIPIQETVPRNVAPVRTDRRSVAIPTPGKSRHVMPVEKPGIYHRGAPIRQPVRQVTKTAGSVALRVI